MAPMLSLACLAFCLACSPSQTDDGAPERAPSREPTAREPTADTPEREPPRRPAFAPTTECIEPPQPAVILEVAGNEANPRYREIPEPTRRRYQAHEGHDLDGDGHPELFVPEVDEHACPHEVRYAIYVMRGDCGHYVGSVLGSAPHQVEPSGAALDDMIVERQWTRLTDTTRPPTAENVATLFHETVRYRFDGERYVRGEPEVTSGICHHCPLLRCRRVSP